MITKKLDEKIRMNNGLGIPQVGLGVWKAVDGEETYNAVRWALELGYKSIDTASLYDNETSVGQAINDCGIPREELFVTTKLWDPDHGYDQTLRAFEKSLKLLNLSYVDSYLLHYPVPGKYLDSWKALEYLHDQKLVRTIGVSNFHANHLDPLLACANIKPSINQIELHPYLSQKDLIEYNKAHDIITEAWAPIAKGRSLQEPIITAIAAAHDKTPAQVILRWELQQGIVIIPKSVHKERIAENSKIFDFSLTAEEMAQIDTLHCNGRIGKHPDEKQYD